MITVEEAGKRYVERSLIAYLRGEKDLKWIAGVLREGGKAEMQRLFESVKHYGVPARVSEFEQWLNQQ